MGRRGGGGFGGGGSKSSSGGGLFGRSSKPAPKPAASAPPARKQAPPPAQAPAAQPPMQQQGGGGGMLSGLAGTMMSGMAFGTGSAVANRAIDSVMGPREMTVRHEGGEAPAAASNGAMAPASGGGVCGDENMQFQRCMQDNPGDLANCRFYFDVLNQCQDNSKFR